MKITSSFKINALDLIMKNHGLGPMGKIQQFIDSDCIRRMGPYIPFKSGYLSGPAISTQTIIGTGEIKQKGPYVKYLYYEEVFGPNIPIIKNGILEGFYSPPHKEPTGRKLRYNTAGHPKAGGHWFDRMIADQGDEVLAGARKVAGGKS